MCAANFVFVDCKTIKVYITAFKEENLTCGDVMRIKLDRHVFRLNILISLFFVILVACGSDPEPSNPVPIQAEPRVEELPKEAPPQQMPPSPTSGAEKPKHSSPNEMVLGVWGVGSTSSLVTGSDGLPYWLDLSTVVKIDKDRITMVTRWSCFILNNEAELQVRPKISISDNQIEVLERRFAVGFLRDMYGKAVITLTLELKKETVKYELSDDGKTLTLSFRDSSSVSFKRLDSSK